MPTYLTLPPSRAPRRRGRRARRGLASRPARRAPGARRARSRAPAERGRPAPARSPGAVASAGCARPRRRRPSGRRAPAALPPPRRNAGTSRGRGTASRRTGPAGRPRRSPSSGKAAAGAAPVPPIERTSGGEPLAALRAAALQDEPAGTGRHAGTEPVLALPPAHVGLVGAFHELPDSRREEGEAAGPAARRQYRRTDFSAAFPQP